MITAPRAGVVIVFICGLAGVVYGENVLRGDRLMIETFPNIISRGQWLVEFVQSIPFFNQASSLPRRGGEQRAHDFIFLVVQRNTHLPALRQIKCKGAGQRLGRWQSVFNHFPWQLTLL